MLEAREQDLVALFQQMRERARQRKCERGHVGAEHDLARRGGAEEVGHRLVRQGDDLVERRDAACSLPRFAFQRVKYS